jgi:transporter family-2 protein
MAKNLIMLLLAAFSGTAMALQGSLNAALGKIIGLLEATFVVHILGTLFTIGLLAVGLGSGSLLLYSKAPWYTFFGGFLGVAIVYAVATSISLIGVATATTAIIVGQTFTALIIDHLGLFGLQRAPFSYLQVLGVILLAAGAKLMLSR